MEAEYFIMEIRLKSWMLLFAAVMTVLDLLFSNDFQGYEDFSKKSKGKIYGLKKYMGHLSMV